MFDPHVPLSIRLLSLFHVVTPPLLLWAVKSFRLRPAGGNFKTLTAWTVVPIQLFSGVPQYDVNWARGPFFREQHAVPGFLYLAMYLIIVSRRDFTIRHTVYLLWFAARRRI